MTVAFQRMLSRNGWKPRSCEQLELLDWKCNGASARLVFDLPYHLGAHGGTNIVTVDYDGTEVTIVDSEDPLTPEQRRAVEDLVRFDEVIVRSFREEMERAAMMEDPR